MRRNAAVSQKAAEESLVLLKNEGDLLPLRGVKSIAVIGGSADKGVLAGAGSSDVTPVGGAVMIDNHTYLPSPPLDALKRELPKAKIASMPAPIPPRPRRWPRSPTSPSSSSRSHNSEGSEASLELAGNQDALVAAVAKANPKTIVVAETGGAIYMPWVGQVPAILEAFYPGIRGGPAIARILTGKVNPSGHLPISFPASPDQLARPDIAGLGEPDGTPAEVLYDEGAAIGYKWYDVKGYKPLFWFGHGLSYTRFALVGPDGAAGRQGDQGQLLDPQYRQARRQGRRPSLCRARRLEEGRMGSAKAARRLRQGRPQARAEPSASS